MCVRYGANVNLQNVRCGSRRAARDCALRVCGLTRLVCPPSVRQHRGNTAMHFAVAYGFTALAEWLKRAGANPALRNTAGRAAAEGIGPEGDF